MSFSHYSPGTVEECTPTMLRQGPLRAALSLPRRISLGAIKQNNSSSSGSPSPKTSATSFTSS